MYARRVAQKAPDPAPAVPRVLVIANKFWEADPLVNVLLSDRDRPDGLTNFAAVSHPLIRPPGYKSENPPAKPRITFTCGTAGVEVWCVQDLMNTDPALGSNSAEKARVLPQVFKGVTPSMVIAFGTAGYPDAANLNGCAVIGSRVFVHDPKTNVDWRYKPAQLDTVSSKLLADGFFRGIDADVRFPAEGRFVRPPMSPADPPVVLAGHNWIAISTVNVTNYDDYVWTDPEAISAFKALQARDPAAVGGRIGSMESTHGIIKEVADATVGRPVRFLFVSAITDQIPLFDIQVTPRVYAQNFVAAHNAGVALAWLLPEVVKLIA